jgi:hypothetical protein
VPTHSLGYIPGHVVRTVSFFSFWFETALTFFVHLPLSRGISVLEIISAPLACLLADLSPHEGPGALRQPWVHLYVTFPALLPSIPLCAPFSNGALLSDVGNGSFEPGPFYQPINVQSPNQRGYGTTGP